MKLLDELSEEARDALRKNRPSVDDPGWQELARHLVDGHPIVTGSAASGEIVWSLSAEGEALRAALLQRDAEAEKRLHRHHDRRAG